MAQGVPAHIGTPTPRYGYESGDPFAAFLPSALRIDSNIPEDALRAIVFIVGTPKKGAIRSGQEYESPLLVLTGAEYGETPFQTLHDRLCDALRGDRPRLVLEKISGAGATTLMFENGSTAPGPSLTRDGGSDDGG